jgi:hypothetical protein
MSIIRRDDGDRIQQHDSDMLEAEGAPTCRCGADLSAYVTERNLYPDCCGQCANMLNRRTQRLRHVRDWRK